MENTQTFCSQEGEKGFQLKTGSKMFHLSVKDVLVSDEMDKTSYTRADLVIQGEEEEYQNIADGHQQSAEVIIN